jgi:hypothetical protein
MIVLDDGVFTRFAVEPAKGVTICGADSLLARLEEGSNAAPEI